MKQERTETVLRIDKVLTADGSPSHWLGYSDRHGWLLLDRSLPGNEQSMGGIFRKVRFVRLKDWKIILTPLATWHDGSIRFYKLLEENHDLETIESALEEWRRRRLSMLAIKDWKKVAALLVKRAANAIQVPPLANEDDLRLCFIWSNKPAHPELLFFDELLQNLIYAVGSYDSCRLLSARRAEMLAKVFYTELGAIVSDISITQMTASDQGDWKNFDLDVGYPIDVKNARATFNGKQHYAEHAVARFKNARDSGYEVRIVGVRSPYHNQPIRAATDMEQSATVLGEVSLSDIEKLTSWLFSRFGRILKTTSLWHPSKVPGWLFEYPEIYYSQRAEAIQMMSDLVAKNGNGNPMKVGQWLIAEAHGVMLPSNFGSRKMVSEIRDLLITCGLAKRCLILYSMCCTLEAALLGKDVQSILQDLKEIFNSGFDSGSLTPLGLHDPLGYVERFFEAFYCLSLSIKQFANQIISFHLTSPEVLLATMKDGRRLTFLAYCGGWVESKGRCGYAPLVAGYDQHCNGCGKLICPTCHHCTETCDFGKERKHTILRNKESNTLASYMEDIDDGVFYENDPNKIL